ASSARATIRRMSVNISRRRVRSPGLGRARRASTTCRTATPSTSRCTSCSSCLPPPAPWPHLRSLARAPRSLRRACTSYSRLVVASEALLHWVCPARAHQCLRGLLLRGLSLAALRPGPGARSLWTAPRPAQDAALPRPRYGCLPLCPLPCHHMVQSDPQGHGL